MLGSIMHAVSAIGGSSAVSYRCDYYFYATSTIWGGAIGAKFLLKGNSSIAVWAGITIAKCISLGIKPCNYQTNTLTVRYCLTIKMLTL